jgi:hypothetical protein
LEKKSMNVAVAASVVLLGAVLVHARGQGKGDRGKEKQTADSSASASKGDAPPLAALGRGDKSKGAQGWSPVPHEQNRVQHSYVQRIHASADKVFAVLEPVEEVKWAPGFEFEWVYAKDGPQAKSGQEGDVFITRHQSGLGSRNTAVWVISRRDMKERRVQFVRTVPDFEVTQIDIHVVPNGDESKCEIRYTFTALSHHGLEHIRAMTKEHFDAQMKEWEEQVNRYLGAR